MSQNKQKSTELRRSPVSTQMSMKTNSKPKTTPKNKVTKATKKSLSNGVHTTGSNGVVVGGTTPDEKEIAKINLKTLQKVDPTISRILATVPHVVLYEYKDTENMWERTSSEGTLFVYQRESTSEHGFMILNRLNSENTQEPIKPNTEFRLQPPFVLYGKESGSIFGLCIQDKDYCLEIGKLLNELSSARPSISNGVHSHTNGNSLPLSKSTTKTTRSKSPSKAVDSQEKQSVAVLELLEVAGRNYLGGQSFSDDTDSHDEAHSPPAANLATSHTIATTASAATSAGTPSLVSGRDTSHIQALSSKAQSTNTPSRTTIHKGDFKHTSPRSTSPREIPNGHHQGSSHIRAPQTGSHSPSKQKQSSKHHQKDNDSLSTTSRGNDSSSSVSPRSKRRGMHHTVSLDRSRSSQGLVEMYPGSRSNSLFETSPRFNTTSSSYQQHHFHSAQIPSRAFSATTDTSSNAPIIRKLFDSHTESSMGQEAVSSSLQNLFSRATAVNTSANFSSSTGNLYGMTNQHPKPSHLMSALSLDEIEKQMTEEAPSSDNVKRIFTVGFDDSAKKSLSSSLQVSSESSTILLQPSAFTAVSTTVLSLEPPREPPSVVVEAQSVGKSQSFPSIPPLMPSAGMTAPPLSPLSVNTVPVTSNQVQVVQGLPHRAHTTPATAGLKEQTVVSRGPHTPPRVSAPVISTKPSHGSELSIPGRSVTVPSTLMSPQQFSQSRDEAVDGTTTTTNTTGPSKINEPVGLTTDQMKQALMYLIQNDHGFIDKLHDAYHLSLKKQQP